MADAVEKGAQKQKLTKEQVATLLAQFADAKRVNRQIDDMFAPLTARIKKEAGKKDFNLFALFFKETDVADIKKQVKDSIVKIFKEVKTDKLLPKVKVAPVKKAAQPKVEAQKPAEVFGTAKTKNANVVEIAGIEKLITKIDSNKEEQFKAFESVVTALTKKETKSGDDVQPAKKKKKGTRDVLESKNAINVNLVGVDEEAIKKLGKLFHKEEAKPTATQQVQNTSGWLEKMLAAILAGWSAAKLLAAAFGDTGPLRGALKLIGDVLLKTSSIIFKGVIRGVTAFIKLLPESVLKKLSSASGSISKIGSTLTGSIGKIASSVGSVIGKMGGFLIETLAKVSPTLAKGVTFIGGALGKLASGFGKFLFKRLKILPFIGPFIGFGFAIKRMIDGDYVGGLGEMLGNLLAIVAAPIPPLSFAISILTDLLLAGYDIKTGGTKNSKNSSWNKWLGQFGRALLDTGPIRWLRNIGEALGDILIGDWKKGFVGLYDAIGDIPGVGYIMDLLGVEKDAQGHRFEPKDFDIIGKIKDEIIAKVKAIFSWAKDKFNAIRKFFGLGKSEAPEAAITERNQEADKAFTARKKLEDNAVKAQQEQQKPYAFEETREKRLNEITAERTNLQAQIENAAKKSRVVKAEKPIEQKTQKPATIETENTAAEAAIQDEPIHVEAVSEPDQTEEVRKVEIEKAKENNKELVSAIQDLKKTQEKKQVQSIPEKKPEPQQISVVSSVNNSVKPLIDVNVDTSRDNVYERRNNIRGYLFNQRAMI